ncbi:AAA family ATPase [Chitinophaga sp. G-6-1-13]|uniref:AAA family ATPase n=1 Tax=Chitinophaga fulva TaxID=2728842 RepID=A0A848GUX2_9BACT|nr:AAA family ATPase [Chitinophaga fulva]NML40430.1 AAA family ATPase [Chitinophaga fulva]
MNFLKRLCSPYQLNEVFTPNTVAKLTYVKRQILEDDLTKYIGLPGKQIVVYGHSGSGKTTLILNILKNAKINYIKTHCESATTFDDLLLQAFDKLNRFYITEKTTNYQYSISSDLKAEYKTLSAKISESNTNSKGEKSVRLVPQQLTPEKLAQFLGEVESVWLIEDFHKVNEVEKRRIADVIKIFIDAANDSPKVKIICIGAVGTARELIELDNNLRNRIAEMSVPLLKDEEIKNLIKKGDGLLHIKMPDGLIEKIVYYSNNLGSLAHQICYDICYHDGIIKSRIFMKEIHEEYFRSAVESYVRKNSDTFSKLYDMILSQEGGWNILQTFDYTEKEHLSIIELTKGVNYNKRLNWETSKVEALLQKLATSEFEEVIRYDRITRNYSISSPFFKAFLKMKFALKRAEDKEVQRRRHRKRKNMMNLQETGLVINAQFFETYYQYLDSYLTRKLTIIEKDSEL